MPRSIVRSAAPLAPAALALAALAACADPSAPRPGVAEAPVLKRDDAGAVAGQRIPGQYIVVFHDDGEAVDAKVARKLARHGGALRHTYATALRGMAVEMNERAAAALAADPDVAYVEEDQVVTIDATQSNATWGIDRIDQRSLPRSGTYTYTSTASNVRAYIIDTGILTGHQEFGGRATNGFDAFTDGRRGQDCNGHGTHVAGTVGGAAYGVAKGVRLIGVRVLDCQGSGTNAGVIAGINWVASNAVRPAVANLSLGGGASQAVDDAVNNLSAKGVFVAVAAGNSNANACNYSPARASSVTTVAASTSSDAKASYSNYGSCVELYAPGSSITSAWWTSTSATNTISGTSMASPHVAGVGALYLAGQTGASPSTVRTWLINNSTASKITGNVTGTPNRLLFKSTL
jgi:subtilisin family serine protease